MSSIESLEKNKKRRKMIANIAICQKRGKGNLQIYGEGMLNFC
jgi:hypothetical protein